MAISNGLAPKVSDELCLQHCCAIIYRELWSNHLQPGREELVRNKEGRAELECRVREVWVEFYGGDPEHWPWNRSFVVEKYISYRKKTRDEKGMLAEPPMLFQPDLGTVYFIQNKIGRIKIGWTGGCPKKRLKALQTGDSDGLTLVAAMDGSEATEKALHFRFAAYRVRSDGEWFYPNKDLSDFMKGHLL